MAPSTTGLDFIAIAPRLTTPDDLQQAHRGTPRQELAEALAAQWPPATPNLHRIAFDGGRVQLLLARGAAHDWLPQLRAIDHNVCAQGVPGQEDLCEDVRIDKLLHAGT